MTALCLSTSLGCLALEDEPYYGDEPISVNRLPVILDTLVQPRDPRVQLGTAAGCTASFSIRVEDVNVDDQVTVRWYIDYDESDPVRQHPYGSIYTFTNNGKAIRDDSATLRLRMDAPGNPLSVPTEHLVEAVVTDALSFTNRDPADGSAPPPYASFAWFVTTRTTDVDCTQ